MNPNPSRRRVLQRGVGLASALAVGSLSVQGCGTVNGTSKPKQNNAKVGLPDYVPFRAAQPDLAGTADGVLDTFFTYPNEPQGVVDGVPSDGGTITALAAVAQVPPPVDKNLFWRRLNERLGTSLSINMVPANLDYTSKLATILAGNEIPDIVQINPVTLPRTPSVLAAKFQDLAEHLSGDAVRDYPFLANIPSTAWRNTAINGGIYGVPYHFPVVGNAALVRLDILKSKGISELPSDIGEFFELCKEVTDPRANRWAMAYPRGVFTMFQEMSGVPNNWREDNGKFTSAFETDEIKDALSGVAKMWSDRLLHPDSFSSAYSRSQWFSAGTIVFTTDSFQNWKGYVSRNTPTNPEFEVGAMPPPTTATGKIRKFFGTGMYTMAAIKSTDSARVKQLLKVINVLAAPFGSQEYLFHRFGIEGHDYVLQGSDPVLNSTGINELSLPIHYITNGADVIYQPGYPDSAKRQYDYMRSVIPNGVDDPSLGLYSPTSSESGPKLETNMYAVAADVFQGRKSPKDWDDAVNDWKKGGGDTMRREYEDEFAKAN